MIETNIATIVESKKKIKNDYSKTVIDLTPKNLLRRANHIHVYLKEIY